ncbi:MAG TPA: hypothetical protein VFL47_14855, partial [Flavisolibacter sp.]|nr:hypothetical protein [Flavisolibacter sp.]
MRKFLLFFLPAFLVISSSFVPKTVPRPGIFDANQKPRFSPQDWIVDEPTAQRMMNYFTNCAGKKCHRHQKQKYNFPTEIDNYIKSMYDVISINLENARYDDADVSRYRQARGLAAGNHQGDVSGYSTVLTVYK